jgi:WD40 repeat protein
VAAQPPRPNVGCRLSRVDDVARRNAAEKRLPTVDDMANASGILTALRHVATRAIDLPLREIVGRDYFISYARRDGARYAARLARLLAERHTVYIDQLDVPRGAELPARLRGALRQASVLVLVGSPEAVRSDSIRKELILFLPTGRPAMLVDVDGALGQAPWSEPPWAELSGVHKEPESRAAFEAAQVSPEVLAFIRDSFTSTKQDRRLRRDTLVAACVLVAAMAGAWWFSTVARNASAEAAAQITAAQTANKAREQAEELAADAVTRAQGAAADAARARKDEAAARVNIALQERMAASRRLADDASARLTSQPDLGFLLAAHALDAYPTQEARLALFDAVAHYPGLDALTRDAHRVRIYALAVSGDGQSIATRDIYGGTFLWDVKTRQSVRLREPNPEWRVEFHRGRLALSPSGHLLAASDLQPRRSGSVEIWDVSMKMSPRHIGTLPTTGDHMAFVSENLVAVESGEAFSIDPLVFWDISDPALPKRSSRLPLTGPLRALAVDPARGLAVFRDAAGLMMCRVPCTNHDRLVDDRWEREAVPGIAVSRGPRSLAAAMTRDGQMRIWDLDLHTEVTTFRPQLRPVTFPETTEAGVAFSPEGDRLAVAGDGGIVLVDMNKALPEKEPTQRVISYGPRIDALAFVGDGRLVIAQSDGAIAFLDPVRIAALSRTYIRPPGLQGPFAFAVSGNGRRVVIDRHGELLLWSPGSNTPPRRLPVPFQGAVAALAVNEDGHAIAALGSNASGRPRDAMLIAWDDEGRERLRHSTSNDSGGLSLEFIGSGHDERLAVFLDSGIFKVYDVKTTSHPRVLFEKTATPPIWQHAFDRSGRRLAALHRRGIGRVEDWVSVFDIISGRSDILKTRTFALSLAFADDGRTLVGFRPDTSAGRILRWNLSWPAAQATQSVLYEEQERGAGVRADLFPVLRGPAFFSALSNDAALIALGGDGRVVLWDVEQRLPLGTLMVPSPSHTLTFSRDGTQIFASDDQAITIIDVDPNRLAGYVCSIAARALTDDEVRRFRLTRAVPSICMSGTNDARER